MYSTSYITMLVKNIIILCSNNFMHKKENGRYFRNET